MKLRLNEYEFIIILSFLLGKFSGLNVAGAVADNWGSLVYSAVILPVLFVLLNAYQDRKAAHRV